MGADELEAMQEHYALGAERDRLAAGVGLLEFLRTTEIVSRWLPDPPAVVADVGGGPGRYAFWLADRGYTMRHRDVAPLHVEQVIADRGDRDVETRLADARRLDLADESVDAVLLLGPLYHLVRRADRVRALREARRIVVPGGVVFVAAISRWAGRVHGILHARVYEVIPEVLDLIDELDRTGYAPPLHPGSFTGYYHRPKQLVAEVRSADLELAELLGVEGPASLLDDLDARLADERDREVVLETARRVERVPDLLGSGPHLLAVARRPATTSEDLRVRRTSE